MIKNFLFFGVCCWNERRQKSQKALIVEASKVERGTVAFKMWDDGKIFEEILYVKKKKKKFF